MSSFNSWHHAQIQNDLKTFHLHENKKCATERADWGDIVINEKVMFYDQFQNERSPHCFKN